MFGRYRVKLLVAADGERLPMLIRRDTEIPCELALRWSVLERREHCACSTMQNDQEALAGVYQWSDDTLGVNLDTFLKAGQGLSRLHITSLAQYVKVANRGVSGSNAEQPENILPAITFNKRWDKISRFLLWVVETYTRDPDGSRQLYQVTAAATNRLRGLVKQQHVGEPAEEFKRALTPEAWAAVESALRLDREDVWPDPRVRFRNHTMVYLIMNTGLRPGELL